MVSVVMAVREHAEPLQASSRAIAMSAKWLRGSTSAEKVVRPKMV